jgi:hypothetical protein
MGPFAGNSFQAGIEAGLIVMALGFCALRVSRENGRPEFPEVLLF